MRMRRKKYFAQRLEACSHLLCEQPPEPVSDSEYHFGFVSDMYLEIGCGKGGFAVQFAAANPGVAFYAMERVANVMVNAVERAEREKDTRDDNLRFIIGNAEDLPKWFAPGSLSAIYLNFSDPWPKARNEKRRLTHKRFLTMYMDLLREDGSIYFKTDNRPLFDFTLEQLAELRYEPSYVTYDLHSSAFAAGNIMTEYETNFTSQGIPINALAVSKTRTTAADITERVMAKDAEAASAEMSADAE